MYKIHLLVVLLFVLVVIALAYPALNRIETQARKDAVSNLQSHLKATKTSLKLWEHDYKEDILEIASSTVLVDLTKKLLALPQNSKSLLSAPALEELRIFVKPKLEEHGDLGIFIISPQFISVASMRNSNIGTMNIIARKKQNLLEKVFQGSIQIIPPIQAEVLLPDLSGNLVRGVLTMFVAAPIRDESNRVIAVLTKRINTYGSLNEMAKSSRTLKTVETYFFDNNGEIFTESRFQDQLFETGLLKRDQQKNIQRIEARDPGGNMLKGFVPNIPRNKWPLTQMAEHAIRGRPGVDYKGCRNYRGVPVLSAWQWNEDLGFGMTTEIDVDEALQSYYVTEKITIGLLTLTILLSFIFLMIMSFVRRQAEKNLRNNEYRLNKIMNSVLDGIITINERGIITSVNNGFADISGYKEQELLGLNVKVLMPQPYYGEHDKNFSRYLNGGKPRIIGKGCFEYPVLRKDGTSFPIELVVREMYLDGSRCFLGVIRDITERKKTAEKIEQYADIVKNMQVGLNIYHMKDINNENTLRLVASNPAAEDLTGISMESFLGKTLDDNFPGVWDKEIKQRCAEVIRTSQKIQIEEIYYADHPVPNSYWSANIFPIPGNCVGLLFENITERKQVEVHLRKMQRSVESAEECILMTDKEGVIHYVNPSFTKLTGYSSKEVVGCKASIVKSGKQTKEFYKNMWETISSGEGWKSEITNMRKDGSLYQAMLTISPVFSTVRKIEGYVAVQRDITDRKQAEEKLQKSEAKYRSLFEFASDSIFIIDPFSLSFLDANENATKHLGYTHEELLTMTLKDINLPNTILHIDPIVKGMKKNSTIVFEQVQLRKDGKEIPVEISSRLIEYGGKQVFQYFVRNITERKQAESELEKERQSLEEKVNNRTMQLRKTLSEVEDAKIRMEEASQAKSRFLSSMSHELRTPLNGILGFADLLIGQFFGSLNEEQLGFANHINNSGQHLLSLINDLLDMAKIESGAAEIQVEDISAKEIINSSISMIDAQLKKKNLRMEMAIDPSISVITVDGRRFKQILLNLLSNAIKYTPDGGRIEINLSKYGDSEFKVEVRDTGIGIEADDIENIFSEFYQAERVRDEQLGGTGIGLALTRRLVELHGGKIGVESYPGKGSTFWFNFPFSKGESRKTFVPKEKTITKKRDLTGHRVLVVEDKEINLTMITKMLSILRLEVQVARNGREAIDKAQSFHPELILMDIRMPVMNGSEATRHLRAKPEFSDTPIIALTASTGSSAKALQMSCGCTGHLAKPVQSKELFAVLEKHLLMRVS